MVCIKYKIMQSFLEIEIAMQTDQRRAFSGILNHVHALSFKCLLFHSRSCHHVRSGVCVITVHQRA